MEKTNEMSVIEETKIGAPKIRAPIFSKEQLLQSARFSGRRDLLNALLDDNKQYTLSEAETALNTYLKGKVK